MTKQMVGRRFSVKWLTCGLLWLLSLSWINGVGAHTIITNADENPFSNATVVKMAEQLSQGLFITYFEQPSLPYHFLA